MAKVALSLGTSAKVVHPLRLGAWAAETTPAANCPQQSIFRRFLGKYPDIRRRNRQKLSSLGPIFAQTPYAAQAPRVKIGR